MHRGPLRVAVVCPYSLSRPGGVQGQAMGLARALTGRGHRVTVFAPSDAAGGPPGGKGSVEVVVTGRPVAVPANGSVAPVSLSVPAVTRALRVLRAGRFDLVHVHEPFAPGLPYGILVGRHLPPVVATFHRSGGSPLYRAFRPLVSRLAGRLDLRCAVSEAARATAEEALGGAYALCFNGVEVGAFEGVAPWPSDRPALLFLGRHEARKGLGVLLEAHARLRGRDAVPGGTAFASPVLWIAGDGPETGPLRQRYPEADDLRWLGVLSEEEKLRRLVGARALCAPSLGGESFGMVLLEAMAARTEVVASDIPGYREAAGGKARLVPAGDVDALAGVLARLLSPGATAGPVTLPDGDRREAAWAWAEHWSMDRLATWYEDRYRWLVAGSAG